MTCQINKHNSPTSDPPLQLDILRHDRNPLGMNRRALKPQICLKILSNLSDKPLEWELPDQKLSALLVLPDLTERHRVWPETMRLLHATGRQSRFTHRLGGELLARGLASDSFFCCC